MRSQFKTQIMNSQIRFQLSKIIILYLLIDIILTFDLSGGYIKLRDTEEPQKFQCNSSLDGPCLIQFKPTSSFLGIIEVTYVTQDEHDDFTYKYTIQSLFCIKDKQICDFNGQYMSLRNLSLEIQFNKDQEYNFTLQTLSNDDNSLITTFKINKGSSCLNNNCNKNGQCITFNGKKQCSCFNQFGGKNCEAQVATYYPNVLTKLSVPQQIYKIIQYSFKNTAKEIFEKNQLDFTFKSAHSQKTDIQKLSFYILDGQSSRSNSIYKYDLELTIENQIDINKLFSSSNSTSNLIILIMIYNENNYIQDIDVELKISDISESQSSSDTYFIYILIGVIGFTLLIIIIGFIYFIIKRRQLKKNQSNNLTMLAQVLLQNKIELKETENFDKYQKIFNEALPSQKMSSTKLNEIIQQNSEKSDLKQSHEQDLNSSEIQNANQCICSICLQQIQEEENYRETICKHLFHIECIDIWIQKQHNCPMCRVSHKSIDLLRYLKEQKPNLITETHQINGKTLEFEMHDNTYKRINSSESSPLGFIPILPLSLTRQQSSTVNVQELASPQKITQTSPPLKTSELQMITLNESNSIHIPDNSNDLINLQLPQSSINESSIPELICCNNNNMFNSSQNTKNKNEEEQNSTLTKIVDIMNNNYSSIINFVSNGKFKNENITNLNKLLKPILEEDNNSSQTIKSSNESIFMNDQYGTAAFGVDSDADSDSAMKGSQLLLLQGEKMISSEYNRRQTNSGIKLNYNFELQPQAQAQFLKSQFLNSPNVNDKNNDFLFKPRLTK